MATLFDSASLVMIPSGYKEDKVYSIKPTDGSGDLAFSRSNDTATRVNSSGLIEKVRTNLVTYSEQFDNAAWTKTNLTITANSTAAPDGTLTADTITDDATSGVHNVLVAGLWNTTQRTASVFAKAGTSSKVYIQNAVLGTGVFADLSTNTLVATGTFTGTITNEGSGWFRITATHTAASPSALTIGLFDGASTSIYAGTGSTAFIWGAQVENGDIATDYIVTTSAAVSVGPVANLPRLDYSGGASCPKLLLEPQRTNLFTSSEQFDNADWLKQEVTLVANAATSPDGYTNADLIYPTSNGAIRAVYQPKTISASTDYTQSVYVKSAGKNFAALFDLSGGVGTALWVNLTTGEITNGVGSNVSNRFATNVGNGWWRIGFTQSIVGTNGYMHLYGTDAAGSANVTVNGTDGIYAYGAQLEAGAYATSYIPTLSAASTRGADSASKTGISSLIGQTEGTLFMEFEKKTNGAGEPIWLSDGTYNNFIYIGDSGNALFFQAVASSVQWNISSGALSLGRHKVAAAYKQNDIVFYVDGVQVGTDTSANIPTCSLLGLGYENGIIYNNANPYQQVLLFKTRLTNAELAALTTI